MKFSVETKFNLFIAQTSASPGSEDLLDFQKKELLLLGNKISG